MRKKNIDDSLEKFCLKTYEEVLGRGLKLREFFFLRWQKLQHICMLMGMIQSRWEIMNEGEMIHLLGKTVVDILSTRGGVSERRKGSSPAEKEGMQPLMRHW